MCEDKLSMQPRRQQIIQGLRKLPGLLQPVAVYYVLDLHARSAVMTSREGLGMEIFTVRSGKYGDLHFHPSP